MHQKQWPIFTSEFGFLHAFFQLNIFEQNSCEKLNRLDNFIKKAENACITAVTQQRLFRTINRLGLSLRIIPQCSKKLILLHYVFQFAFFEPQRIEVHGILDNKLFGYQKTALDVIPI